MLLFLSLETHLHIWNYDPPPTHTHKIAQNMLVNIGKRFSFVLFSIFVFVLSMTPIKMLP